MDPRFSQTRVRLRIRQFRYPSLIAWKVFEIAAFLPLLIQASLPVGLFFVGLCICTWSADSVIGKSVTSFVIAWFVLFSFAAFAPLWSSACPYKIPPLLPALKCMRRWLVRTGPGKRMYSGPVVNRVGDYHDDSMEFYIIK